MTQKTKEQLDAIAAYWNARAESYSNGVKQELETGEFKKWIDRLNAHVDMSGCLKVLDIGTGPGFFPVILGRLGHDVTAIDYSEDMINQAKENVEKYKSKATFIKMDAQDLKFEDNTFDLIVTRDCMWDLPNPDKAYREWMRVLKPKGTLFIRDANNYLYLYNEDYAKKREEDHKVTPRRRYIDGVDGNIIQAIAEDLPLSRVERPQWDICKLIDLGVKNIQVETDGTTFSSIEKDGGVKYLHDMFFMFATKE